MKSKLSTILVALIISFSLTSCEAIEGIFKAGMGVGAFAVIIVIVLIIYLIIKIFGKK
ncbi:hypothetical protein OIU80_20015 [Flavobacterium sp. LS1R47]|jgi:hypothetical protein|uniref:Phosphatidate cytidylyltransferase n=1 Tax=Flavobacterium frigoritolerans TaxID=2987686 RepID=A0A9X3CAF1_9FLAO|nr:hypothetical protein [Flavobacterium frigoritolerans]MCV9934574.1 hypothetical protein [Flavobacterium frigoritolerans]